MTRRKNVPRIIGSDRVMGNGFTAEGTICGNVEHRKVIFEYKHNDAYLHLRRSGGACRRGRWRRRRAVALTVRRLQTIV
jgi:hypothetical protein